MTTKLTKQEKFFYDNAGYSWNALHGQTEEDGHHETAVKLAAAETWAIDNGYYFDWMIDPNGCSGCGCESDDCACSTGADHETYGCIMRSDDDKHLQSLWSICNPDAAYRRVVEAELALEEKSQLAVIAGMESA